MQFRQVQPRLAAESDFVEQLLSTSHSIVVLVDRNGRIMLFNDTMGELCGHSQQEMVGRDFFECFVPEPQRARLRALFERSLECEDLPRTRVGPVICPILTRTGKPRQMEWETNTVRAADGELLGTLGIGHDVTEKVELRAKLIESERLANIGIMASVLAHEIGNPLNAIHLQVQVLRRLVDRPERGPLGPRVDSILAEVTRLNAMLEDFRAYRDFGRMPLALTDLRGIIAHVADLLAERAAERRVAIACEIDPSLPQVLGNGNELRQVLSSLCKNGIEAMPDGGKLRLRARAEQQQVCVDVIDDGPRSAAKVDAFAREIIAAHGGTISRASAPERGTTFTVSLPSAPVPQANQSGR